jgi:ribonuclease HI
MSPDELSQALHLLPRALKDRARAIRARADRADDCPYCRIARQSLDLALRAAVFDELEWARTLVTEAEHYMTAGRHPHDRCGRDQPPPARAPVHGRIRRWERVRPVIAATDASWKRGHGGLGYVTSTGHWGFRSWRAGDGDPTGHAKVLVSELRAVDLLLSRLGAVRELVLLVDSLSALAYLRYWRDGRTHLMPEGYDLRPRHHGVPTLVRLAERMAALPGISLEHVKGHSGHLLNEAADSLASIARRRLSASFDATARAEALAESFLLSWHQAALAA